MFKFIHIADVHFDTIFATKEQELREHLRNALYNAFKKTIDICIDKEVHGLLIAGDLFETSEMSFKTERFLMNEFKRLDECGIKVFYTIGNHDAGINKQTRKLNWPNNIYIFDKDSVETFEVIDKNTSKICKVSGCGHITSNETRNLISLFPVKQKNETHIGVVHTMVTNAKLTDNEQKYLPCNIQDLESKNYNYWALGHIHKRQQVGEMPIYYAGNPQGLKSKEVGEKGVLYIEIDSLNNTETKFIETAKLTWKDINIDITNCFSSNDLIGIINTKVKDKGITKENSKDYILKIHLEGRSILKQNLRNEEYKSQLREELIDYFDCPEVLIRIDNLKNTYDMESIKNGKHVVAEIFEVLREIENVELMNELTNVKLANQGFHLSGEKEIYIKELLNNIDEEVVEYFLEVSNED